MNPARTVDDDTSPEMRALVTKRLQAMTPSERVSVTVSLNKSVESLAIAGILQRHPEATEHEIRMRLGVLRIGAPLMREIYGWDADEHGL